MKRPFCYLVAGFIFSVPQIMQAAPYGFAGCGAGTRIFGPRNMQTSASTTNHGAIPIASNIPLGLPTSQPWSISLDLAGCGADAEPVAQLRQYDYTFTNFASIAREGAQGEGKTLEGLAATFGCPTSEYEQFANHIKDRFQVIFSQPGIRATFDEMRHQLADHETLSQYCTDLAKNSDPDSSNNLVVANQ